MKIVKLLLIILWFITFYNWCSATTSLSVSIVWWNTQSYYYNESVIITANATFPESCTSTWITWTKTIPWYPFPTIITVWSWPTYNFTLTWSSDYTVTANCSASSIIDSVNISIKDPIVTAWVNSSYNSWDLVNLSWSIEWASWCNYDFIWEQISWTTVAIDNSFWNIFNSSFTWSYIFPSTWDEVKIKLKVTPQSCYYAWNTYSWTVTYTLSGSSWENNNVWRSVSYRMQDEANAIFNNKNLVDKINMSLTMNKLYSPLMQFSWNNVWWEWYVNYKLEYSTWSNFSNSQIFETTQNNYNFIEYNLDKDCLVHYFRLKACYQDNCSQYSNTIKYLSEDYFKIPNYKDYFKITNLNDIFFSYDMLIEKFYKIYSDIHINIFDNQEKNKPSIGK